MASDFSIDDRSRRMSRYAVSQFHEISPTTLRLIEAAGGLKTYRGPDGRVWFDRVDVEGYVFERKTPKKTRKTTLKYRAKARLSARVFELFRQGLSWQDVVIETKADPDRVLELEKLYRLSPEQVQAERTELDAERQWRQETRSREWKEFRERMAKIAPPAGVNRDQMAEIMRGVIVEVKTLVQPVQAAPTESESAAPQPSSPPESEH